MTKLLTPEITKKLKALSNVEPTGIISASTNFLEGSLPGRSVGVCIVSKVGDIQILFKPLGCKGFFI